MKKVRYAIGVLGAAPALGLMAPAANAAPTVTHTTGNTGKTVSLEHGTTPLINCGDSHSKTKTSVHGHLRGKIKYSGTHCIFFQSARLNFFQSGLTERVRFYGSGGGLIRTTWQAGKHVGNTTVFSSSPNSNAFRVCEALVPNGHHSIVDYGPVCETP